MAERCREERLLQFTEVQLEKTSDGVDVIVEQVAIKWILAFDNHITRSYRHQHQPLNTVDQSITTLYDYLMTMVDDEREMTNSGRMMMTYNRRGTTIMNKRRRHTMDKRRQQTNDGLRWPAAPTTTLLHHVRKKRPH